MQFRKNGGHRLLKKLLRSKASSLTSKNGRRISIKSSLQEYDRDNVNNVYITDYLELILD